MPHGVALRWRVGECGTRLALCRTHPVREEITERFRSRSQLAGGRALARIMPRGEKPEVDPFLHFHAAVALVLADVRDGLSKAGPVQARAERHQIGRASWRDRVCQEG